MNKFYADVMGFLDLPGKPPIADKNLIQSEIGANINLIHLITAPPWLETTEEVLASHREFVKTLEEQKIFKIIRTKNDLKPFADGTNMFTVGVVSGLQKAPNDVLESGNLKRLFDAGIRIMTLAYEGKNNFGGGCMEPHFPFLEKGKIFLSACAENEIIFDFSHAGFLTSVGIIEYLKKRQLPLSIMASHSGFAHIYNHLRNIDHNVASFIYEKDGVIGIPTLNFILEEEDDEGLNNFMRHIEWGVYEYGTDNICVGSDGVYNQFSVEELKSHHKIMFQNIKEEYRENWKVRFPEHPLEIYTPRKMQIIAEKLSELYSQKVVDKICGLNFAGFLERSLPDN